MAKFFTGFFIGAVGMLFVIAHRQLREEEESSRTSKSAADAAVENAKSK